MRFWAILFIFFSFACSPKRFDWQEDPDFRKLGFRRYLIKPVRILATYHPTSQIQSELHTIKSDLNSALKNKGFEEVPLSTAQFYIQVRITALPILGVSSEEARFLRGVHGSNFPNANPRAASAARDGIEIYFLDKYSDKELWSAWCALPNELLPHYNNTNKPVPELESKDISQCIYDMISKL